MKLSRVWVYMARTAKENSKCSINFTPVIKSVTVMINLNYVD